MVRDKGLILLFWMWTLSFPTTIYWVDCVFSNVCFWHLCWKSVGCKCVDLLLDSLFQVTGPCLFLCHNPAVLVIIDLQCCFKSCTDMYPVLLLLAKIALTSQGLLQFHTNFRLLCLFLWRMMLEFWYILHLICRSLWEVYDHFNNINSFNSRTQDIFPSFGIFLNCFHQCFTVFIIEAFHLFGSIYF